MVACQAGPPEVIRRSAHRCRPRETDGVTRRDSDSAKGISTGFNGDPGLRISSNRTSSLLLAACDNNMPAAARRTSSDGSAINVRMAGSAARVEETARRLSAIARRWSAGRSARPAATSPIADVSFSRSKAQAAWNRTSGSASFMRIRTASRSEAAASPPDASDTPPVA